MAFDQNLYNQKLQEYLAAMGVNPAVQAKLQDAYVPPPQPQTQGPPIPPGLISKGLEAVGNPFSGASASATGAPVTPEIVSATRVAPTATNGTLGLTAAPGTVGGSFLPALGVAAGAYTGAQQIGGVARAVKGDDLSLQQQIALALPTFGTSFLYNPLKKLWDKDAWKTEQSALGKLAKKGVTGWEAYLKAQPTLTKGRSKGDLLKIEQDKAARGEYSNAKFAESRDEKDLKGKDIWGYSAFGEKFGNDWLGKFSEKQREQIADEVVKAGAFKESKGSGKISWNQDLENKIKQYVEGKK
jgi:hypothetical protein